MTIYQVPVGKTKGRRSKSQPGTTDSHLRGILGSVARSGRRGSEDGVLLGGPSQLSSFRIHLLLPTGQGWEAQPCHRRGWHGVLYHLELGFNVLCQLG
jgi:hypothetical protein